MGASRLSPRAAEPHQVHWVPCGHRELRLSTLSFLPVLRSGQSRTKLSVSLPCSFILWLHAASWFSFVGYLFSKGQKTRWGDTHHTPVGSELWTMQAGTGQSGHTHTLNLLESQVPDPFPPKRNSCSTWLRFGPSQHLSKANLPSPPQLLGGHCLWVMSSHSNKLGVCFMVLEGMSPSKDILEGAVPPRKQLFLSNVFLHKQENFETGNFENINDSF